MAAPGAMPLTHAQLDAGDEAVYGGLTFGVKHISSFAARRSLLTALIKSIRAAGHATQPILVAYDGDYRYARTGPLGERYLEVSEPRGLSAGRNAIARHVTTEFVMIMDDDVLFHAETHVGTLLAHMLRDPALGLVAACYHPSDCYAHNLTINRRRIKSTPVLPAQQGLTRAHLVQNLFLARSSMLRANPWDERQRLMEHETFFAKLVIRGVAVGLDPSVTAIHQHYLRTEEYNAQRHVESTYLQYLCRNFPRLSDWQMPCMPSATQTSTPAHSHSD